MELPDGPATPRREVEGGKRAHQAFQGYIKIQNVGRAWHSASF